MSKLQTTRPPWLGRAFSRLIVGSGADSLRGDLDESVQRRVEERGDSLLVRAAYVADVVLSVAHWWWSALFRRDAGGSGASAIAEEFRLGARLLMKNPGFTLVATISLAVGIGTTTTVFSLLNASLLKPLPVRDAATLVSINKPDPNSSGIHTISYPDYLDYVARTGNVFSAILAWTEVDAAADIDGQVEQSYGMLVSGNYFSVLDTRPAIGRLLTPEEDRSPGEHPVVVLSYDFWQRRFGRDSSVVGRGIELNGQRFTVIGVAAQGFTSTYNVFAPVFYAPLAMQPQLRSRPEVLRLRGWKNLKLTARLAPGVSRDQAQAALNVLDAQLEREHPPRGQTSRRMNLGLELLPVGSYPGDMRLELLGVAALLLAIVGSVLLIACANVAGMLLARATARRREMGVRLAMGATRARLIRQLLIETSVLFLLAAALGTVLTVWLTRLLTTLPLPVALPFALDASVDWRVLGFTLLLAMVTAVAFGLAPALEASGVDLHTALKDAPASHRLRRSRVRHSFVVAQIALSLVLLIGAGLFARALRYAQTVHPGREPETVLMAMVDPEPLGYSVERGRELYQQLTERIAALPGVEGVSVARELPMGMGYGTTGLAVRDASELGYQRTESNLVAPGYFKTLGIRMLDGRDFTVEDRASAPRVVIVSEALARRYWPGRSALHRQVRFGDDEPWAEIIGVVEDGRHRISGEAAPPFVYSAFFQSRSNNSDMILVLRNRGDRANMLAAMRRETQAIDRRLALKAPMTLSAAVGLVTLPWRVAGGLATVFGIIGLALAALGIYGLVVYTVSQRTHEIGVRVALGADPLDIRKLVIGQGLKLAVVGVAIGLTLSLGMTRALGAFLFGISASDPVTYLGQSLVLVAVAVAASYVPARKATRTDPLMALRHE